MLPFLLLVYAIPIGQIIRDRRAGDESVLLDLFRHAPTRENIRQFEDELDKASTAREFLRPRIQAQLTRFGGYGNGKATIGRGGWLFYAPGITAVGGPPFLDPEVQAARRLAAETAGDPTVSPDPRPAILDFARFLAGRGIRLVVFPVPDKASLQPLELHGRRATTSAGRRATPTRRDSRPSSRRPGVLVFDPTPDALEPGAPPRFMKQDTHWTPAWMEEVAGRLARFPRGAWSRPARPWGGPRPRMEDGREDDVARRRRDRYARSARGADAVRPGGRRSFTKFRTRPARRSSRASAGRCCCSATASRTCSASSRWAGGRARGSRRSWRGRSVADVDVIARNDAGAHATRRMLLDALAGGEDRLAGKTVVVWELASRELAVGDFKPLDWSALTAGGPAR